jgi:hypothetical protein
VPVGCRLPLPGVTVSVSVTVVPGSCGETGDAAMTLVVASPDVDENVMLSNCQLPELLL